MKSIYQLALDQTGPIDPENVAGLANIVINNQFDIEAYRFLMANPDRADEIVNLSQFESMAHVYRIAQMNALVVLASTFDREFALLPNPNVWIDAFNRLASAASRSAAVFPYIRRTRSMVSKSGSQLPKTGSQLPDSRFVLTESAFAEQIADALCEDLGATRRAAKTVMRWTGVSDRTARAWLQGRASPSGLHLVALAARSELVMARVLSLAGHSDLGLALQLNEIEAGLEKALVQVRAFAGHDVSRTDLH